MKVFRFIILKVRGSMFYLKEIIRVYIDEEKKAASLANRDPEPFNSDNLHKWANSNLKSPRSAWLYSVAFSFGTMLVILRAAIRLLKVKYFYF